MGVIFGRNTPTLRPIFNQISTNSTYHHLSNKLQGEKLPESSISLVPPRLLKSHTRHNLITR